MREDQQSDCERSVPSGDAWELLAKSFRKIRESGLTYTLQYALSSFVPGRIFAIEGLVVLGKVLTDTEAANTNDSCSWISSGNTDVLARAGYSMRQIESRFAEGARAAIMLGGDRVVACSWYSPGTHADVFWIRFDAAPGDVWNWDVWVNPELRGQGIAGRLTAAAERGLRTEGYWRVVNTVNRLNRNSLKAFTRAGYAPLVDVFFVRFFGWTMIRVQRRWRFGRWTGHRRLEIAVPPAGIRQESEASPPVSK